ncbi:Guanine nucleotide exchange factor VAV2 [Trichinella papuae]|uniref:Guanine nucleotide exchange factor VAV2 n=1 Tax=Trichinella papuae TaxID=268474 RepID=A0A0V1MWD6_9BILA|nr:Guanine nucleotide exchange factor VAV2 [Trichinella papuae]
MEEENELWRQCAAWFTRCGVLDENRRALFPKATLLDFAQALRDGVLLCQLVNRLHKDSVDMNVVNLRPQLSQFLCSKNIWLFLNACQNVFGLSSEDICESADIYKAANFGKVLQTLSKLSNSPLALRSGIRGFPEVVEDEKELADEYYNNEVYRQLAKAADSKELDEEIYDQASDDERDQIYDHIITRASLQKEDDEFIPNDQRGYCIKELVDTERKYVNSLHMIIQKFYLPLKEVLSFEEHNRIFMNLPVLLPIHSAFLSEIQTALRTSQDTGGLSTSNVAGGPLLGDVFVKYKRQLTCYSFYCSSLTRAQRTIDQLCSEKSDFRQKVLECQIEANANKFRLQDVLVVPMQRVLKYHLLLKELLKHTPIDHEERFSLQLGWDAMRDLSLYLNEVTRDCETRQIIQDIQASIVDISLHDNTELCDYGRLLKDGEIKIASPLDDRKLKNRYIFVFDKLLLICKHHKGGKYSYKSWLLLENYEIQDVSDWNSSATRGVVKKSPMKFANCFRLQLKDCLGGVQMQPPDADCRPYYLMHAQSEESKNSWLLTLRTAHENVKPPAACLTKHVLMYTSFDQATECSSCEKLLRGLFFQGYKCAHCGVKLHKECISSLPECGRARECLARSSTMLDSRKAFAGQSFSFSLSGSEKFVAIAPFTGSDCNAPSLTFRENDVIQLLSMDVGFEGQWLGRIIQGDNVGQVGFFKPEYVRRQVASSSMVKRPSWQAATALSNNNNNHGTGAGSACGGGGGGSGAGSGAGATICNHHSTVSSPSATSLGRVASTIRPVSLSTFGYVNLEELTHYPWYVGEMDRLRAEQLIMGLPLGTFLVRFSRARSQYAISISYSGKEHFDVKHVKVELDKHGFYLDAGRYFPSLVELVNHYEENNLNQSFQALDTTLKIPVKALIVGFATALHSFEATSPNMVSFQRNDMVIILSKKDSERGWWKGMVVKGSERRVGYFPCSYLLFSFYYSLKMVGNVRDKRLPIAPPITPPIILPAKLSKPYPIPYIG